MVTNDLRLTDKNLVKARKMLFDVTGLLVKYNIEYHLEGGTLLGIVRDKDLLPWDHDVDISIPGKFLKDIMALQAVFLRKGYRMSMKKSKIDSGPIKKGDFYVFKIKPLWGYVVHWFLPSHFKKLVVLDIFLKVNEGNYVYWQAMGKTMRVDKKYYESCETVAYLGNNLRAPNHYKDYLTEKYGDWSVPVKDWDCGENELTIVKS